MDPLVYVTQPLPEPGVAPLVAAGLNVEQHTGDRALAPDELRARVAEADALLCLLTDRIDAALLDAAPRLRVVANLAVGFDNIDVPAVKQRGIVATNTPDVLTEATADLAWALLLATARRVGEGERFVRSGGWTGWDPTQLLGRPVHGQTLGILGMGKIGTAVARRARGFDMDVLYTNRHRNLEGEQQSGAESVSFGTLLERSDFISIHAPLNYESRHIFEAGVFKRMKATAILINTARGALVDEAALVEALRAGTILGAGLDVYEDEPALAGGLVELENVVLLPHVGSATVDTRAAMVQLCCDNIVAVLSGRPPLTPIELRRKTLGGL